MSSAPARFPRSGWLAVGVAGAAAANAAGVPALLPVEAGVVVLVVGLAERAVPARARMAVAALGLGAVLLGLRVLFGPGAAAATPLPGDAGPWTAVVESVGSPRDGAQVARLRLTTESGEVAVAATLPAFPPIAAGDVVDVGGRLRPPPDDDPYGDYLRRSGAAGTLDARVLTIRHAAPAGLQSVRDASGDALQLALPEPEAGLAAGILVGLAGAGRPRRWPRTSRRPASATSSRSPAGTSRSSRASSER